MTDTDIHRAEPPLTPPSMGTILSIWAHPDDETYLAAGIMAAARDGGQRVVCASATAGEHGTDDPTAWPPERLGRVRSWEAAAAMAVLGVREHHVLGLPDGRLDEHDDEGLAWAGRLLDEVRPDTILTFGPDGVTYHPDHIAVHRWVTTAWRDRGRRGRLLYAVPSAEHLARFRDRYEEWGMYMSEERPVGVPTRELSVYTRLDGADLDRKLTALRALSTQTAGVIGLIGPETYAAQVSEETYIAAAGSPVPGVRRVLSTAGNGRSPSQRAGGSRLRSSRSWPRARPRRRFGSPS